MVPRARAVEAMTMLRAIGDRIDRHLLATEIRSMAGDGLACIQPSIGVPRYWALCEQTLYLGLRRAGLSEE
jgi:hypothetical protein